MNRAMALRGRLLGGQGSAFDAIITADYSDTIYTFEVRCKTDRQGNLEFQVLKPEPIEDISGTISAQGGKLTFDDVGLAFDLLADGQVSPVCGPWLMMKALQGGYVRSSGMEDGLVRLTIDDSYHADALQVDIWLGTDDLPVRAEVLFRQRRILSLEVSNYEIL